MGQKYEFINKKQPWGNFDKISKTPSGDKIGNEREKIVLSTSKHGILSTAKTSNIASNKYVIKLKIYIITIITSSDCTGHR